MSELDLFAIGRCGDQVTRENLESDAISLHSKTSINHRIYAYAVTIVLLMLINGIIPRSGINKYSNQNDNTNKTTVQTEHDHNDVRKNVCSLVSDRMALPFAVSTACR